MTSIACTFAHVSCILWPLYLGKSEKSFLNSIIYTYFRLFTLSQKKTNYHPLTHHTWKMPPHYLVKCTNFSFVFIFFHACQVPIHNTDTLQKCLVATWAEFQQSVVDDAVITGEKDRKHISVQKVVTLNICCRLTLLAWHSICHTSQPVLFRATNVWRNATYLQSDEKVVHFTR